MGLSITKAALQFDLSAKSANDLRTFSNADPEGAAAWLAEVASTAKNAPASLGPLAEAAKKRLSRDELVKVMKQSLELSPQLFDDVGSAVATAKAQVVGDLTLGWTAGTPSEPPRFVGHLEKGTDGVVRFKTTTRTFDVDLSQTDWREELETAFMRDAKGAPQLISIKGVPSADGKRLHAMQFAPGAGDFVAGRVKVEGDKVFIRNVTHSYEVTSPEFLALLKGDAARNLASYDPVGVIVPGKPGVDAMGQFVIDQKPDGFFILGRLMQMNVGTKDGRVYHHADTGYFKSTAVVSNPDLVVPPQSAPGGPVFDANDGTKGSTGPGQGPRAFFYARILPHDATLPADVTFPKAIDRRIQILAVSDQGDNGIHSPNAGSAEARPSADFGTLADLVPASAPDHTPAQATVDPTDD